MQPRSPMMMRGLLALASLALVWAGLGGAHLHLCLDGSEPPTSLHFVDGDYLGDHHADTAHTDIDLPLFDEMVVKSPNKPGVELPVVILLALVFLVVHRRPASRSPPRTISHRDTTSPSRLRPPLRGPPLLTS